ncbi:CehA/McbA family metallohydrolase [bacterium]|nr:CehA/McbA family metallohydrolase [bacterium]
MGLATVLAACGSSSAPAPERVADDAVVIGEPAACAPGQAVVEMTGAVTQADAKTYQLLPVDVGAGTGRIEVAYQWTENGNTGGTPLTATTLDLGLWDSDGFRTAEGFRGWSGSRQGRLDRDTGPVFIQADVADRGYTAGPINAGTWFVELGIAAVGPEGASWLVQLQCLGAQAATVPAADPVDATHVANTAQGWYAGDFHMHAFHSQSTAPDWDDFIAQSRAGGLDFLMVTEYVTGVHWNQLGAVQRAHPDLIIWPGREIITYFGHANTFGETPETIEYRHGFEAVSLGDVQADSVAADALFQVNHPTTFEGEIFSNFCRGCAFELGDAIDWSLVDTIEVQNGPAITTAAELGLGGVPGQTMNPFTLTALDEWDSLLNQGFRITGVSGSDSKGIDAPEERNRKGYGSSATMVFAENLSRPALADAIRAGHAYVRTLGVDESPEMRMTISTDDGQSGMYGDTVFADSASLRVEVLGAQGQGLTLILDGEIASIVPVIADPFSIDLPLTRLATSGPAGTFARIQITRADGIITVIGNPVFVQDPALRP